MPSHTQSSIGVGSWLVRLLTATCGTAGIATADILNVPADYPTIQEAIDAAVDGDEVLIAPGTYTATAVLIVNDKAITLRGSGGADVTFLENTGGVFGVLTLANVESDTVIDGLTFSNTNVFLGEGVLGIGPGSTPTIQNCAFVNNSGTNKPVIGGTAGAGLTILNCSFTNNLITPIGLSFGDVITIDGCTFEGNTPVSGHGGAIRFVGGGSVINCTFDSNATTGTSDRGGAIFVIAGLDITIDNCTFNNNMSPMDGGGAIFAVDDGSGLGSVTISNCDFTGNTAATDGGAVLLGEGALSVQNCTFDGNSATNGGGAHLSAGANATNCTFTGNQATGDGGGAHLSAGAGATGCTFTNNLSPGNGAGLAVEDANATNCMFTGNQATGDGGAMYVLGTTSVLINCDATGNTAFGAGGGLRIPPGVTATMSDSVLCMNTPDQFSNEGLFIASNVLACDQPLDEFGACCLPGGGCVMTTETSCLAAGGTYQGDGTDCRTAACPKPCPGDINGDGVVGPADLSILLGGWGACF